MKLPDVCERLVARRYRGLLLAVVLAGIAVRLAVYADLRVNEPGFDRPSLDSQAFLHWAGQIAAGDWIGDRPFFLNPLYPYFLAPILKVAGAAHLGAIRLVQVVLGLASVLLVAGAVRRLATRATAIVAAALCALYPLLVFYEQVVMIVTLAVFLNALLLFVVARSAKRRGLRTALGVGVVLGLSILARPNVALFGPVLLLWFLRVAPAGRRRIVFAATRTAAAFAGTLLVILPVTARNWAVGHDLVWVTSSMGVNLWQSNNPEAVEKGRMFSSVLRAHPRMIENDARLVAERAAGRALEPSEVSSWWAKRALAAMREHPGRAVGFLGRKLLLFLSGREAPSSYHYAAVRDEIGTLGWNPLGFGLLCPLALLGAFVAVRGRERGTIFVWLFATYAVGLTIFFPLAHYRAPVLPAAFALAAIGAVRLGKALAARRWRPSIVLTAVLAAAFLVSGTTAIVRAAGIADWGDDADRRAYYYYNRGLTYLFRQDLGAAQASFRKAREEDPTSFLADSGMAHLARSRGDREGEERYLAAALAKNGSDPELIARHGRVRFELGRREEGLAEIERAAALGPLDHAVFTILARIYADLGRWEDALAAYERAEANGLARVEIYADQSRCLRALGRPREALRRVDHGLGIDPAHPLLHVERAFVLLQLGETDPVAIDHELEYCRRAGAPVPPVLEEWVRRRR